MKKLFEQQAPLDVPPLTSRGSSPCLRGVVRAPPMSLEVTAGEEKGRRIEGLASG